VEIDDRAGLDQEALAALTEALDGQRSLEAVVRWGLDAQPPRLVADVVVQDEFTHDVILPYRDGLYLVYDTT
jgi:hypothetical protein